MRIAFLQKYYVQVSRLAIRIRSGQAFFASLFFCLPKYWKVAETRGIFLHFCSQLRQTKSLLKVYSLGGTFQKYKMDGSIEVQFHLTK